MGFFSKLFGGRNNTPKAPTMVELTDAVNAALLGLNVTIGEPGQVFVNPLIDAEVSESNGAQTLRMRANGDTISLAYLAGMATVVLKGAHSANAGEVIFETGISTRVVRGKLPKSIAVGDRITFSKLTTPTMVKAQKAEGNPAIA